MRPDAIPEFFSVLALLVMALVLAVWLVGISVERDRQKRGWNPPRRPSVKVSRILAKDCPSAIPVSDMPGYYWIGWGTPVHGMTVVDWVFTTNSSG